MNKDFTKKEFNNSMRQLDREESSIDKSMSKYYRSTTISAVDILYYSSLVALNVVFWIVAYLYLYNTIGVNIDIWSHIQNLPIYMYISILGIVLCRIVSNMLVIKICSRYTRPIASFRYSMKSILYDRLTYAGFIANEYILTRSRIGTHTATTIDSLVRLGEYIFIVLVSVIMSILFMLYVDLLNVAIAVLAMLSGVILVISIIVFVRIVCDDNKLPVTVFRFCKFLYTLRLVKDVDYAYQVLSLKIITMSRIIKDIRRHISSILVSFISCVVRYCMRAYIVYCLLGMFVSVNYLEYVNVLVCIGIIDGICYVYPPKNKVVVKDILVLCLFSGFGLSEYLFIFGLLYVLLDYYVSIIIVGLYDIIDRLLIHRVEAVLNKSVSKRRLSSKEKDSML